MTNVLRRCGLPLLLLLGLFAPMPGGGAELVPILAELTARSGRLPSEAPPESLKSGLILLIAQYAEWPEKVFAHETDPIVIGVLGLNPFGHVLEDTVRGLKSKIYEQRPIQVRYVKTVEEAAGCQVVFIAQGQKREEETWLQSLRGKPVLLITESEQSRALGAMVWLVFERQSGGERKLRFDANLSAAREADLRLSAKMLQSARKVYREPVKAKEET